MNLLRRTFKPLDLLIILFSFAVVGGSIYTLIADPVQPELVRIQTADAEYLYPLSEKLVLQPLEDPGTCVIEVAEGSVRVISSECPRRICISMGTIDSPGGWIACLPHQVFIEIPGNRDGTGVDAVAQ